MIGGRVLLLALCILALARAQAEGQTHAPAHAQGPVLVQAQPVDRCLAISEGPRRGGLIQKASLKRTEARLTFVGHSTFLIESAAGVRIATDYNDYVKPALIPEIVTMNRAHSTHYTESPEREIKHVLRGWNPQGGPITHNLEMADVRVRNVNTNIRDFGGGTQLYGNSIFIFELAGLCIGHLGHIQHTLTQGHYGQIGQLDVVLVPVDGGWTLDLPGLLEVIKELRARVIVPMHFMSEWGLQRFLDQIKEHYPVRRHETASVILSRLMLPDKPEVIALPGR